VALDPTNLSKYEELDEIIARLGIDGRAQELPAHWAPWRRPVPALPIDDFIATFADRTRKPRLRSPAELTCYRLGECPYAMARSGVSMAIEFATLKKDFIEAQRTFTTSKLKDLKGDLPALEKELLKVISHISAIGYSQEQYAELDWKAFRTLQDHFLATVITIQASMPKIESLHLERSQYRGNLWRQAFVGSLFHSWWALASSDPSSNSAPFLDFVQACWLSLSPDDLPEVSWESAIDSCLRKDSEKWWRDPSHTAVVWCSPTSSDALDLWVEENPLEIQEPFS
jgi:hypothetical protein